MATGTISECELVRKNDLQQYCGGKWKSIHFTRTEKLPVFAQNEDVVQR